MTLVQHMPLQAVDFPLVVFGSCVFTQRNEYPVFIMGTNLAATDIARRLNRDEQAQRIAPPVLPEPEPDHGWTLDGAVKQE